MVREHDELTHRAKHELREIAPDPKAWLEGPEPKRPRPWGRYSGSALFALAVIGPALIVLAAFVLVKVFAR